MSHEIRTPMNAVIGMTSLLQDTALDPQQREFVNTIRMSGEHLLGVINDILDFSKIEAGKLELQPQQFQLRSCVEEALELVAVKAAEAGLEMVYEVDDGVPEALLADAGRLRQILANLLSNAVKFTPQGEVVVRATTRPLANGQHVLTVSVRDTGVGMAPDAAERLFAPFTQVDVSPTLVHGGTGLGLAISRRLCELMGGGISVESEPGRGSTFTFTIRAAGASVPPRLPEGAGDLEGRRVLVVDDNDTNRRILTGLAHQWKMRARDTASPAEALRWVEAGERFGLALLDHHMPEMDGIALAKRLQQLQGREDLLLVLMSSGLGREEDRTGAHFAAVLTKPVKHSQLYDTLRRLVADQPAPETVRPGGTFDPDMASRLPLQILLAEDNPINQKLTLLMLSKFGYRADVAGNGMEAVAALARQPYDAVLMDVQMPVMAGCEATRQIRRRGERRPWIIAMTANALEGDREACLAAGMDDYLSKPITPEALAGALSRARTGPPPSTPEAAFVPSGPSGPSGPAEAADAPGLDPRAITGFLVDLGEGGAELLKSLVDEFFRDAPNQLAIIRRGLTRGALTEVERAAHTLRSTALIFGATSLGQLCGRLGASVSRGALEEGAGLAAEIEAEFGRVRQQLELVIDEVE